MSDPPVRASILGGSGFTGGELCRLLLAHPRVSLTHVTSRTHAGRPLSSRHPNLRGTTDLTFTAPDDAEPVDIAFLCLPHGVSSAAWDTVGGAGTTIIDLSADFRLRTARSYQRYYGREHPRPELLESFVYGLAELNRDQMAGASRIATGGCNATASILGLLPLYRSGLVHEDRTVLEVKVGSSEGGRDATEGSHHPLRSRAVRPFKPTGHRHTAEIEEALSHDGVSARVHLSITSVDMVRGAVMTASAFTKERVTSRDLWSVYREAYGDEPFVRIVARPGGPFRLPEPGYLSGSNFCDVGFEADPDSTRVVVISAIDNLMKGAAGQAVQAMNVARGWPEDAGLTFPGLFPN